MRSINNRTPGIAKIKAIKHIRRMHGGSQAHMCTCSDGYNYIVKCQNNPEGNRTLANDLLGTLLARYMGLPVPDPALVDLTEELTPKTSNQILKHDPGTKVGPPGRCFGSKYWTPRMPGSYRTNSVVPGDLNRAYLSQLCNLRDFAGMLVFDKWVCNTDPRQVIFVRNEDDRDSVMMIDFGYCFHGPHWRFPPYSSIGVFGEWYVYNAIEGMEAFEPWLQILENDLDENVLRSLAGLIPSIWYDFDVAALRALLTALNERRKIVRKLLGECCSMNRHSFRNWTTAVPDAFLAVSG